MASQEKKKFNFRFPLWVKTLTVLMLSVFIVGGAAITFFSSTIRSMTRKNYIDHSVELADALSIYLDLDKVKTLKNKVDEIYQTIPEDQKVENSYWGDPEWEDYKTKFDAITSTPEYIDLFNEIATFHSKVTAKSTCLCYVDLENNRLIYLVDDSPEEDRCFPGSFDDFTKNDMSIHKDLTKGFAPEITNMPEYGYLVSVGRPIFDESNNVIAFSMLDLSMDAIIAKEKENIRTLTIIVVSLSIGTVLVGFLLVLFLIERPVRILTKAANEYATGNDEELNKFEKINIHTKDEIEDLSNSMKKMEKDINRYIVDLLGAEKKADEMKHLADRDAMTGMNNKRSYFEIEERLNEQIKQGNAKFAIVMIDLNDLKTINDTKGHGKGDEAIIAIANSIKETFKNSETYRIGGDEFVVVCEGEDLDNVNSLRKRFKNNVLSKSNDLSAAVGIAIFDPKLDNNFEDTFKRADKKMYQNKKEMKK